MHVRACSLMLAHCAGARACTLTETCDVSSLVYMRQHSPFSIASIQVTPEAIMRHWNARAQECSVAMLMLMHARTVALVLELAACAERSDWVTYLLLYPVMLMVFITCNCTNYIVIVSHEIMHWACASPAAHILQRKVGFTKKTKNSRNIFTDQFVEKSVNHVRRFCGKHLLAGMEHKMVCVSEPPRHCCPHQRAGCVRQRRICGLLQDYYPAFSTRRTFLADDDTARRHKCSG